MDGSSRRWNCEAKHVEDLPRVHQAGGFRRRETSDHPQRLGLCTYWLPVHCVRLEHPSRFRTHEAQLSHSLGRTKAVRAHFPLSTRTPRIHNVDSGSGRVGSEESDVAPRAIRNLPSRCRRDEGCAVRLLHLRHSHQIHGLLRRGGDRRLTAGTTQTYTDTDPHRRRRQITMMNRMSKYITL